VEELSVALEALQTVNEELGSTHQAAAQEHQRHRELFEFAPDGYVVTDLHGTIQETNRAAVALLNIRRDRLAGKPLAVFITRNDRRRFLSQLAGLRQGGELHEWEVALQPRDQPPMPAAVSAAPACDAQGQVVGLLWLLRDITERRQAHAELERQVEARTAAQTRENAALQAEIAGRQRAEPTLRRAYDDLEQRVQERTAALAQTVAALQESEACYRQMFERNRAVKLLIDPETGAIMDANPAAAAFYGYPLIALRRMQITDINTLPPDQVAQEMQRALAEERPYFLFRHRLASGAVRHVEVHSSPLELGGRRLLYSIVHDITERCQAEQALQRAKEELEQRVTERTAALQTLNAQLQAALREKEVLLREIHHRVKNNLQVIASLLSLQADALNDPRLLALFTDSLQRIQAMALVHDILYRTEDLAHLDLGHYLGRLANELAEAYGLDPAHIHLTSQLDAAVVGLDTAIPCGLLLQELLTNCFKRAFADGRRGEVRIAFRGGRAGSAVLQVYDTGVGFPTDLDFHATESLGLQLVCALTEQLQGTIALERGNGTTVTITFPLTPATPGRVAETHVTDHLPAAIPLGDRPAPADLSGD
jgi:PAS domain S-box-containing protein